jgi:hypothetical protein
VRLNADHGGPPRPRQGLAREGFFTTRQWIRWGPTPKFAAGRRWRNNRLMQRAGLGFRARSRNGTAIISRLRVVSFRMAEVRAGSWRKNGEATFRLAPRGKGNARRKALRAGASSRTPQRRQPTVASSLWSAAACRRSLTPRARRHQRTEITSSGCTGLAVT